MDVGVTEYPIVVIADLRTIEGWILMEGAPYLTLVVGALLAKRWLDLPLVALVAVISVIAASSVYGLITYGEDVPRGLSLLFEAHNLAPFITIYAMFLVAAAAVHGAKRALAYWRLRSVVS